jgi:hypothetical protein
MFAVRQGSKRNRSMCPIRRANVDDIDVRPSDEVLPVVIGLRDGESLFGTLECLLRDIGHPEYLGKENLLPAGQVLISANATHPHDAYLQLLVPHALPPESRR